MKKLLILLLILLLGMISCIPEDVYENDGDNHDGDEDIITPDPDKPIVFKDANLEKCIRETIRKSEGEIKVEDVEDVENLTGLTSLNVDGNKLTSLEGIEKLTKLERLYANTNQLDSMEEVANLTELKSFSIINNYLTNETLPVLLNLVNLESLNVRENCITDFTVINQLKEKLPHAEILGGIIEAQDPARCN